MPIEILSSDMEQNQPLVKKVEALLAPILTDAGLELFELEIKKSGRHLKLLIYICHPERGITLDDCQNVSRALDLIMDVEDMFPANAVLEVSSVGLDRLLQNEKDFKYFLGGNVKVKTKEPLAKRRVFRGKIASCNAESVTIDVTDSEQVTIPYEIIAKAKLEISF